MEKKTQLTILPATSISNLYERINAILFFIILFFGLLAVLKQRNIRINHAPKFKGWGRAYHQFGKSFNSTDTGRKQWILINSYCGSHRGVLRQAPPIPVGMRSILDYRCVNSADIRIYRCNEVIYEQLEVDDVSTRLFFGRARMDEKGEVYVQIGEGEKDCRLAGNINRTFLLPSAYLIFSPACFKTDCFVLDYPAFIFQPLFAEAKQYRQDAIVTSKYVLELLKQANMIQKHCRIIMCMCKNMTI